MNTYLASYGPALADHLWQSTAFVVVAWLLTLALRKNRARVRYAIWLAASIKFLVPFSLLVSAGNLLPQPRQPVAPVVYSAMDVMEEPFAAVAVPLALLPVPVATLRERAEAALPVCLGVLWLAGLGAVLFGWWNRWRVLSMSLHHAAIATGGRELEILRRLESGSVERRRMLLPLLISEERMEPGIFGVFRPVLVWPEQLSARLDDEHIEAIVAHELTHVRRRDNLTALIHMLVEAAFWFHPLVWWMERQMVKEREQACDEAVVEMGGSAETYAESLLKTCRFCIESPLACVAGVTGADLRRRVADIVTGRALLRMTWPKKLLIGVAMVCAIALPVMFGMVRTVPLYGQILHADGPLPSFEVATIRPEQLAQFGGPPPSVGPNGEPIVSQQEFRSGPARGAVAQTSDRVRVSFVTTQQLIGLAYGISVRPQPTFEVPVRSAQIVGGPDWVEKNRYQIDAKIDDSMYAAMQKMDTAQQKRQIALMEQSLLAERFKLKVHFETREMPAYALVVAKGVAKLTPARDEAKPADDASTGVKPSRVVYPGFAVIGKGLGFEMKATALSMHDLVPFLQQQPEMAGRMVADQTGLGGTYDFTMNWTREESSGADAPSAPGSAPLLFAALKEQLGLQLVPTKGQVEVLVIDHIEQPTVDGAEVTQPALSLGSLAIASRSPQWTARR